MKAFVLTVVCIVASYWNAFSQCPKEGVRIQSPLCEGPKNLRAEVVSCQKLTIKWQGNRGQKYIVRVTGIQTVASSATETGLFPYSCDSAGHCVALIPVNAGATINWTVQPECLLNDATVYGYAVTGPQVNVPLCSVREEGSGAIQIYPNPSTGLITVRYDGKTEGITEFNVYSVDGKKVLARSITSNTKAGNIFTLNLRRFAAGTYLLKARNGTREDQSKVILVRE